MAGSLSERVRGDGVSVDLRVAVTVRAMVLGSKVGDTFRGFKK